MLQRKIIRRLREQARKEHLTNSVSSTKDAKPPALTDITNRGGFYRPTLQDSTFKCLNASSIRDGVDRGSPSEWTQRQRQALTPTPRDDPCLALSQPSYGL